MAIKITKNLRDLKMLASKIKRQFNRGVSRELPDLIREDILAGVSPVKGFGRFKKYSESYRDQINKGKFTGKRKSPVNMKLTGEMLKSLIGRVSRGDVVIKFRNELADIHNRQGAGKPKVVRRLLPTNSGEEFNRKISQKIEDFLIKVVNNNVNQANRR